MKSITIGVLALVVLGIGAQEGRRVAKDYPKSGVYWSKTSKEAWGEAWSRNVPIFFAIHKEGSEECAAMASLFREKRFVDASRMWVNVIVHPGTAHEVDVEIDGKKVARCELYFDLTCKDHSEGGSTFPQAVRKPTDLPARVFYNAKEQKELGRETGVAKMSDLIKSMDKILAQLPGEKMSADAWRNGKALVAEGDQAFAKKEWQKAIKIYRAVIKLGEHFKGQGEAGLLKVNLEGEHLHTKAFEAQPKELNGDYSKTKQILREIVEQFKSLPVEEKARQFLEGLKKHGH